MESKLGLTNIDARSIVSALQVALAEEFNAWYAYVITAKFLKGNNHLEVEEAYLEFAEDELEDHAYKLMERINQLGGAPLGVLSPDMWNKKAEHKYIMPNSQFDVIKSIDENIKAEEGAIETYMKIEKLTRDKDVTTNYMIKHILADEQEHLQELKELRDSCLSNKSVRSNKFGGYLGLFK